MFGKQFRENLRQLDVRCAIRARWLGVGRGKAVPPDQEAEERLRRIKEEVRRSQGNGEWFQPPVE